LFKTRNIYVARYVKVRKSESLKGYKHIDNLHLALKIALAYKLKNEVCHTVKNKGCGVYESAD